MSPVDDAIATLKQGKNSTRRSELTRLLESLGFSVRDGRRGGHKVVAHSKLPGFHGTAFNAGHGADAVVKSPYIGKIISVLKTHQQGLEKLLEVPPP